MISIEDEIEKEGKWDTRRYNSIERPLKQKNNLFKVEKIKTILGLSQHLKIQKNFIIGL